MKSDDFIEKFRRGEMGDEMDFIWWASIYDLYLDLRERIERALLKVAVVWGKDVLREIDARLYPQPTHS